MMEFHLAHGGQPDVGGAATSLLTFFTIYLRNAVVLRRAEITFSGIYLIYT